MTHEKTMVIRIGSILDLLRVVEEKPRFEIMNKFNYALPAYQVIEVKDFEGDEKPPATLLFDKREFPDYKK